jgi:magnesium chelatase family protein
MSAANPHGQHLGLCTVRAVSLCGLDPQPIDVEVASRRGPAFFQLVGLAEAAVRESRVRVASALSRLGVLMDEYALTVSLAPADLRKTGAGLDLAIAIAVLGAVGRVPPESTRGLVALGELSIEGLLRPIRGTLPLLEGARRLGVRHAIVPRDNATEAGFSPGISVLSAATLEEVVEHLNGRARLPQVSPGHFAPEDTAPHAELSDVRGQASAKRALEIAAAGGHNLILAGPPGSGKTLLARLLPSLLPPLNLDAALETTAIHSVAGLVDPSRGIVATPPFRAPHHTVSQAGLVGGGSLPRPGEVSLAHNGVLFLDELTEFHRSTLEALRQPLEEGIVRVVRARAQAAFPARPLLVGAMNPCPCGNWGNPRRACRCNGEERRRYIGRLSGPLLDRIDLHVQVPPVDVAALCERDRPLAASETCEVRARVAEARERQRKRFETGLVAHPTNGGLTLRELRQVAHPDENGERLLARAVEGLGLSARAYVRVLRVARTIADLEGAARVSAAHLGEAVRCRLLDHAQLPGESA